MKLKALKLQIDASYLIITLLNRSIRANTTSTTYLTELQPSMVPLRGMQGTRLCLSHTARLVALSYPLPAYTAPCSCIDDSFLAAVSRRCLNVVHSFLLHAWNARVSGVPEESASSDTLVAFLALSAWFLPHTCLPNTFLTDVVSTTRGSLV